MTYNIFLSTIYAVKNIQIPMLPLYDKDALIELAYGFQTSRNREKPLYGCIGALDCIEISIKRPPDEFVPRNFYCRKGMYAFPVQAVVDSKLRFRYKSCRCSGSNHDTAAFEISELANKLRNNEMTEVFWIAGDAAYVYGSGLLTPWSKSVLAGDDGMYADSFNFYHSSHRIRVEQAFGVFLQRWGLFWRPIQYRIREVGVIISAAMRLHNFCIDNDGDINGLEDFQKFEKDSARNAFTQWWRNASDIRITESVNRRSRRDLHGSDLRFVFTDGLKKRGITRPAVF